MRARIFQQPKSAMQSGTAGSQDWILEWAPADRQTQDPLMGWFGSQDTSNQVRLRFDTTRGGDRLCRKTRRGLRCGAAGGARSPSQGLCGQLQIRQVGQLDALRPRCRSALSSVG